MPDDTSKRGPADRTRININESWEVAWWREHLKCTESDLRVCVRKVGPMVEDVKKCLAAKPKPPGASR